jgi:hypothetical protein
MKVAFTQYWEGLNKEINGHTIRPLVVLQIEELELLLQRLHSRELKKDIWGYLDDNTRKRNGKIDFAFRSSFNLSLEFDEELQAEMQTYLDTYL